MLPASLSAETVKCMMESELQVMNFKTVPYLTIEVTSKQFSRKYYAT
jgi:hypothetical protein